MKTKTTAAKTKATTKTKKPTATPKLLHAAKSLCYCGHAGDGQPGLHLGLLGHGPCAYEGCKCRKFTWRAYITPPKAAAPTTRSTDVPALRLPAETYQTLEKLMSTLRDDARRYWEQANDRLPMPMNIRQMSHAVALDKQKTANAMLEVLRATDARDLPEPLSLDAESRKTSR